MTKKAKTDLTPAQQPIPPETEPLTCPNCDYILAMTEFADYLFTGSRLAHYRKFECRNCGYVLHKYYPIQPLTDETEHGFPF